MRECLASLLIALALLAAAGPATAAPAPSGPYVAPLACTVVPDPYQQVRSGPKRPGQAPRAILYGISVTNGLGRSLNAGTPLGYSVLFPDGTSQNFTTASPAIPSGARGNLGGLSFAVVPTGCTAGLLRLPITVAPHPQPSSRPGQNLF